MRRPRPAAMLLGFWVLLLCGTRAAEPGLGATIGSDTQPPNILLIVSALE